MKYYANTYPEFIRFRELGNASNGDPIYELFISAHLNETEKGRSVTRFTANIHGDGII